MVRHICAHVISHLTKPQQATCIVTSQNLIQYNVAHIHTLLYYYSLQRCCINIRDQQKYEQSVQTVMVYQQSVNTLIVYHTPELHYASYIHRCKFQQYMPNSDAVRCHQTKVPSNYTNMKHQDRKQGRGTTAIKGQQ